MLKFNIISTGSQDGNCVLIGGLLIDCGVPYKSIKPYIDDIHSLFITHIHSDHLNKSTLTRLIKEGVNVYCVETRSSKSVGKLIKYQFEDDYIDRVNFIKSNKAKQLLRFKFNVGFENFDITLYPTIHDVPNHALQIEYVKKGEEKLNILYATDLASSAQLPQGDVEFDYCFLEANYTEKKLEAIIARSKKNKKYTHVARSKRSHLSKEECRSYYYDHNKKNSQLIELHKSSMAY